MRKFKLIKEYPGSPELNSIHYLNTSGGGKKDWLHWRLRKDNFGNPYILEEPWNYPEFWEEAKEKEYEILEFTYNKWLTFKLNSNGYYYDVAKDAMCFGVRMTDFKEVCINKIRRLSDREVFNLGDKVQTNDKTFKGIIEEFKTYNSTILAFLETSDLEENKVWVALELLQHYKEPILTTEDGYECTLDDVVFGVCIKGSWETCTREISTATLFLQNKHKEKSAWLYFKTKKNAEKYIYENKPEFSRKQVLDALEYAKYAGFSQEKWIIASKIKEKLKL